MTIRPNITAPLVDREGRVNRAWVDYISRQLTHIEPLEASASLADVIEKINEIIAALESAGLSKKE